MWDRLRIKTTSSQKLKQNSQPTKIPTTLSGFVKLLSPSTVVRQYKGAFNWFLFHYVHVSVVMVNTIKFKQCYIKVANSKFPGAEYFKLVCQFFINSSWAFLFAIAHQFCCFNSSNCLNNANNPSLKYIKTITANGVNTF